MLVLCICSMNLTFSQIKVEGVVKDSIGNLLGLANVIALDEETSTLEAYAITDDNGYFKLDLSKNKTYKFQVSYLGMETYEESISLQEK